MARRPQQKSKTVALGDIPNNELVRAALLKVEVVGNKATVDPQSSKNARAVFLLNPDSVSDSKSSNWVENNLPGQSDPILQWVSGGARNVSFTALVTKDTTHYPGGNDNLAHGLADSAINAIGSIASAFAGINVPPIGSALGSLFGSSTGTGESLSIAGELDYYRSLMYPDIDDNNKLKSSPPLVVLAYGKALTANSSNTSKGPISVNSDLWVVKNVEIKMTKFLPNLSPMEAEVSFSLVQYTMASRSSSAYDNKGAGGTPDLSPLGAIQIPGLGQI